MKKHLKWIIPVVVVFVAVCVFGYLKLFAWNPERQKLAQINVRKITVAEFSRELAKIPSPYQEMLREEPKQFLDQLVLKEVLIQEAERLGIKSDPAAKGEDMESSQIQNLLKKEVIDKVKVNKEEIELLYKEHQSKMGKKKLDEVAPILEDLIRDAKGKEKVEEYITSLREKAKVEVDEKRLQDIATPAPDTNTSEEFNKAIKSGKPLLVDFGANNCVPCRQIRPILKEIAKEQTGKAEILIIDVYKYKSLATDHKIQVVPTLIFFDKSGKESYRHMGAWDKDSIVNKLKELGAA
jgi:thioredoxin 1